MSADGDLSNSRPLGTLQNIDAGTISAALNCVRSGEVISLNRRLDGPAAAGRPALKRVARMHNQVRPIGESRFVVVNDDIVEFALQGSTHWDSLAHFGSIDPGVAGVFYGNVGLEETFPEPRARTLGIQAFGPGLVARGVLIDMVAAIGGPQARYLAEGVQITAEAVQSALLAQETSLAKGDVVLMYTGFELRTEEAGGEYPPRSAGVHVSTMAIWERFRIAALAADNVAVEAAPPDYQVHRAALRQMGLPLGELWALHELAMRCRADHRYDFLLVSVPLNIPGAFGSPANAVAIR